MMKKKMVLEAIKNNRLIYKYYLPTKFKNNPEFHEKAKKILNG